MNKLLEKLYYSPDSPCCFSGKQRLLYEAKKQNRKVKIEDVEDFLARQETYTLHKDARRRFERNRTVTAGLDVDWQADLADMTSVKRYNKGFGYLLLVVDVLSRFVWVRPLKRKTPNDVRIAFADIIKKSGRRPWRLMTDKGREFTGKIFQDYLYNICVEHFTATSPDVKAAIAERFIRTLKSKIWKYFTSSGKYRYIHILDQLTSSLNHTYKDLLGCRPVDVTKKNQQKIWKRMYGDQLKPNRFKFKEGDTVRIQIEKSKLDKGYSHNYSKEIFVVDKVLKNRNPATYKLKDKTGEKIDGIFYNEELVLQK